jgi:hypothetical protein
MRTNEASLVRRCDVSAETRSAPSPTSRAPSKGQRLQLRLLVIGALELDGECHVATYLTEKEAAPPVTESLRLGAVDRQPPLHDGSRVRYQQRPLVRAKATIGQELRELQRGAAPVVLRHQLQRREPLSGGWFITGHQQVAQTRQPATKGGGVLDLQFHIV